MRTRIILISSLLLAGAGIVALAASSRTGAPIRGSVRDVVAGFYPLAFAARELAPQRVSVDDLTPPGVEPHDLELSPTDVADLEDADLALLMGRGFQPQLEQAAAAAGVPVVEVLDTSRLAVRDDDPHVWLDPVRFELVVRRIASALGDRAAARPLVARLVALDRSYRHGLAHCARRQLVTSHDAFGYLASRYGLRQIAISGLSPEAEPSPADLARVVERVRASGATTVFGETLLPANLAATVARETGARTAVLNPIESLTAAEEDAGDDYFSLMRANLTALRKGLGCR